MTFSEVARDPCCLLHSVDPVRRELQFRPTTADALRDAAFIDGRTDIWAGPPEVISFDAARRDSFVPFEPICAIFHMSFCGSTLLARLLDWPGKVLSLKEPNCLVDLADWKAALRQGGGAEGDFEPIFHCAAAMLNRPWDEGEQVLLKPSSWANNLIDDLRGGPGQACAVFLTIARDRFLEAVLRGGRPRIAFTARLAAHLSPVVVGGPTRLQAAMDSTCDAIGKAARLALAGHDFELRLFEQSIRSGTLSASEILDFDIIEGEPFEAASRASDALQLGLDAHEIELNVDRWARANAKAEAAFSTKLRRSENEQVRATYGAVMEEALAWAEEALGPSTVQLG